VYCNKIPRQACKCSKQATSQATCNVRMFKQAPSQAPSNVWMSVCWQNDYVLHNWV
jgi:hypothetical protein